MQPKYINILSLACLLVLVLVTLFLHQQMQRLNNAYSMIEHTYKVIGII